LQQCRKTLAELQCAIETLAVQSNAVHTVRIGTSESAIVLLHHAVFIEPNRDLREINRVSESANNVRRKK
jgi:hypothetical protein